MLVKLGDAPKPRSSRPQGLSTIGWPERLPGQPWLAWFIVGTPWFIAGFGLLPALAVWGIWGAMVTDDPTGAVVGLAVIPAWPVWSLVVNLVLHAIWGISGGSEMPFGQTYALVLKVCPLLLLTEGLSFIIVALAPFPFIIWAARFVLSGPVYRYVMELEVDDAIRMAIFVPVISWLVLNFAIAGSLLNAGA